MTEELKQSFIDLPASIEGLEVCLSSHALSALISVLNSTS